MKIETATNRQIRNAMLSAALAERIIEPDEGSYWCYEYHQDWSPGVEMAKYSNGCGDDLFIIFKEDSVIIKGFDHESPLSPYARKDFSIYPGIYDLTAPDSLVSELKDSAIIYEHVTFCIWRSDRTGPFLSGPVALEPECKDGSEWLLSNIITDFADYERYAEEYWENSYSTSHKKKIETLFHQTMSN